MAGGFFLPAAPGGVLAPTPGGRSFPVAAVLGGLFLRASVGGFFFTVPVLLNFVLLLVALLLLPSPEKIGQH